MGLFGSGARQVVVEFVGDDSRLSSAASSATRSTSTLGSKLAAVGKVAAVGLAAGAVVAGKALFDMTKAAMEDEASQARLATALKNTAGATDAQIASVESWISAQGRALGVTDDELRPALEKLVTATGDVGEAQKLAALAMDVSAGSGKSLESVSAALARAANGNVSSLSRLGISTKNAAGETVSFAEATGRLGEAFEGQAASKANTLEGKMGRLKLIFDETKESIGAKLIPVVTQLADWFINEGLPAISQFGAYLEDKLGPAFAAIGAAISGLFSGDSQGKIQENLAQIQEIISGFVELVRAVWSKWGDEILTVAKLAFNFARNQIEVALGLIRGVINVVTGLIKGDWGQAWDGVKQILGAAWKAIQNLVDTALGVLKLALKGAWELIKNVADAAWDGIKKLPGLAIEGAVALVKLELNVLKSVLSNAWDAVKDVARNAWEGVKDIVRNGGEAIVDGVRAIPGKIRDLAGFYRDAGKFIIDAFVNGLKNAAGVISGIAGNVWDAVRSLLNGAISKINAALSFTINLPGPDISVNPPDIPYLAKGGIVTRPTLAMIGEDGPEAVVPLTAKNAPRGAYPGFGGGDGTVARFEIPIVVEGREIQRALLELKRQNGGLALGIA